MLKRLTLAPRRAGPTPRACAGRVRRRPDVRLGNLRIVACVRTEARADIQAGKRWPDDHLARPRRPSRRCCTRAGSRARWSTSALWVRLRCHPARRAQRGRHPQRLRDERLLEQPGGERGRIARRLAALGTSGHGPTQLPRSGSGGGRRVISGGSNIYPREIGRSAAAPGGSRSVGRRTAHPDWGEARGVCRRASWYERRCRRARPVVPRCDRSLQTAPDVLLRRQPAEKQLWQGVEDCASGSPEGGRRE